jgi:hypothetical protein
MTHQDEIADGPPFEGFVNPAGSIAESGEASTSTGAKHLAPGVSVIGDRHVSHTRTDTTVSNADWHCQDQML